MSNKYLLIIMILIFMAYQVDCAKEDGSESVVRLKLDVFALNKELCKCDTFNRTDTITVCYALTNTKEDADSIARNVSISTYISDLLETPRNAVRLTDIDVTNSEKHINDGEGWYLECKLLKKSQASPNCIIEFVEVDTKGHLTANIKNIQPKENDIIYINYSTKVSKDASTIKPCKCSCISPDDLDFKKCLYDPLDLNVEDVYIYNNPPEIEWCMDCDNNSECNRIDSYTYVGLLADLCG